MESTRNKENLLKNLSGGGYAVGALILRNCN